MQIGDKSLTTCQLHRIISGRLKYTSHASDHGEQIMIKVCNKMLNWFLESLVTVQLAGAPQLLKILKVCCAPQLLKV